MIPPIAHGPNPPVRIIPLRCIFCLSGKNIKVRHGVRVCDKCAAEMPGLLGRANL